VYISVNKREFVKKRGKLKMKSKIKNVVIYTLSIATIAVTGMVYTKSEYDNKVAIFEKPQTITQVIEAKEVKLEDGTTIKVVPVGYVLNGKTGMGTKTYITTNEIPQEYADKYKKEKTQNIAIIGASSIAAIAVVAALEFSKKENQKIKSR
jgi:predicted lipase